MYTAVKILKKGELVTLKYRESYTKKFFIYIGSIFRTKLTDRYKLYIK